MSAHHQLTHVNMSVWRIRAEYLKTREFVHFRKIIDDAQTLRNPVLNLLSAVILDVVLEGPMRDGLTPAILGVHARAVGVIDGEYYVSM